MSKEFKAAHKARNVNSKRLLRDIVRVVDEVCNEYIVQRPTLLDRTFEYKELVMFVDMYFADLFENKVIEQYDIIADDRNNTMLDVRDGVIHMIVKFKQRHCLNTTQIDFTFSPV